MLEERELTQKIIGCAYKVYNSMGYSFLESVYEKCMLIELRNAGRSVCAQQPIDLRYQAELVGEFVADLWVEEKVIVELKSVSRIIRVHEVQLVNYLVATGKNVGLLLNFAASEAEVKRKIRSLPKEEFE